MTEFKFDTEELLKDELILTKTDVGERQLNAAIRMFFFEYDPVALHTVAAACHEVLHNLATKRGIKKSIKDSPLIEEHARKDFIDAVNCPQNFFKHADRDPGSKMVFHPKGTVIFLLDAVLLFASLESSLSSEMRILLVWAQLRFPDVFCFPSTEENLAQIRDSTTDPHAFMALARALLREHSPRLA